MFLFQENCSSERTEVDQLQIENAQLKSELSSAEKHLEFAKNRMSTEEHWDISLKQRHELHEILTRVKDLRNLVTQAVHGSFVDFSFSESSPLPVNRDSLMSAGFDSDLCEIRQAISDLHCQISDCYARKVESDMDAEGCRVQ